MKEEMNRSFKEVLVNELDTRNVGGANHTQSNIILGKLDELLEKAGKICDARPRGSTCHQFDNANEEDFDGDDCLMQYEIDGDDPALEGVDTAVVTPIIKDTLARKKRDEWTKQRTWKMGVSSAGILTPLPPGYTFPEMNMHGLISTWFIGDKDTNTPPLRLLHANNNFVAHIPNGKKNISKMGSVMHQVMLLGRSVSAWPTDGRWDGSKVETLYSKVFSRLLPYLSTEGKHGDKSKAKSRPQEASWRTCYNKMWKMTEHVRRRRRPMHQRTERARKGRKLMCLPSPIRRRRERKDI